MLLELDEGPLELDEGLLDILTLTHMSRQSLNQIEMKVQKLIKKIKRVPRHRPPFCYKEYEMKQWDSWS